MPSGFSRKLYFCVVDERKKDQVPVDFDPDWIRVLQRLKNQFGKKPDLEAILFLIGINELGRVGSKFSKEQKQDLMHIAVCRLLSDEGYYRFEGYDDEGWPQWEARRELPVMNAVEQEAWLKRKVITYFENKEIT